jgi:hypothetical protein
MKLDVSGTIVWQKVFGGSMDDIPNAAQQTSDGGYVVAGRGDSFGTGGQDILFLKLDPSTGTIGSSCSMIGTTSVTPASPSVITTETSIEPVTTTIIPETPGLSYSNSTASSTTPCYFGAAPGKVLNNLLVTKSSGNPELSWQAPDGTCTVSGYGIYRGSLPLSAYDHVSLSCAVTGLHYTDTAAASSYYYLVVPLNTIVEGSYGTSFNGYSWTERPIGFSFCHSQSLITCN